MPGKLLFAQLTKQLPIARTATASHHACPSRDSRALPCGTSTGSYWSTGVDVMSKKNRSFLVVSLVPAFLFGSALVVAHAENGGSAALKQALWSDPATWPDHKVPTAGDKVTIEKGKDVLLDVSPPGLHGLIVD